MAKDARLDLGRYITNPFNTQGQVGKRLNFDDLFRSKPETGQYPWNPSRFNQEDLLNRSMTRKINLNPDLNFVGNAPFFDTNEKVTPEYQLFEGLGRFNRPSDYDFNEGRALTFQRPQDQPDFNAEWVEAYRISPTVKPSKIARNPMPNLRNPDPNGYLMSMAANRAKNEADNNLSVADLLVRQQTVQNEQTAAQKTQEDKTEEKQGVATARAEDQQPN